MALLVQSLKRLPRTETLLFAQALAARTSLLQRLTKLLAQVHLTLSHNNILKERSATLTLVGRTITPTWLLNILLLTLHNLHPTRDHTTSGNQWRLNYGELLRGCETIMAADSIR